LLVNWSTIKYHLTPYRDILVFIGTLLLANGIWKLLITGDEGMEYVALLGWDVSAFFTAVSDHVAHMVYYVVHLFRSTLSLVGEHWLRFDNGSGTTIVWSCSGIKQAWIWAALILTARGRWIHKLWFIPAGWVGVYVFNILRIAAICLLIEFHPDWFDILHDYIFKYLFYAMMFGMWVIWIEKIANK